MVSILITKVPILFAVPLKVHWRWSKLWVIYIYSLLCVSTNPIHAGTLQY